MNDQEHEFQLISQSNTHPFDSVADSLAHSCESVVAENKSIVKLFVGSLPYDVNEDDLVSIFEKFGEIAEFSILRDNCGRSRGCAALRYTTNEAAKSCIKTLHNRFCCGSVPTPLQVRHFEKREHTPVTCLIEGLPYAFTAHQLWASLAATYGPVSDVSVDPIVGPYSAYVSFNKKASAFALLNDAQTTGVYIGGMLCPSTQVNVVKFAPRLPSVSMIPNVYGYPSMPYPFPAYPAPITESFGIDDLPPPPPPPSDGVYAEDPPMKLFVGCLPYSKTAQDIADLFSPFGALIEVAILTDYSGKSRGAAFVTFSKTSEARAALDELSGFCFPKSTRPVNISFAYKQTTFGGVCYKSSDHATCSSSSTDPNTPVCEDLEEAGKDTRPESPVGSVVC